MGLIAAKCTQCGANIEVDETREAGICPCCHTAYITEKTIANYQTNFNVQNANILVCGQNLDQIKKTAKNAFEVGDSQRFNTLADEILKLAPDDAMGLFYKAVCLDYTADTWEKAQNFQERIQSIQNENQNIETIIAYLKRAFSNANKSEKPVISKFILECAGKQISLASNPYLLAQAGVGDMLTRQVYLTSAVECFQQAVKIRESFDLTEQINNNTELLAIIEKSVSDFYRMKSIVKKNYREDFVRKIGLGLPEETLSKYLKGLSDGCFIASAVYGSYDCPQVWTLRRFRDFKLAKSCWGRLFIRCYYATSPILVKWFGQTRWFETFWKKRLDRLVLKLSEKGFANSPYEDKNWR